MKEIVKKPALLIVDDDPVILNGLSVYLKNDFHVYTALNGKEGMSIFKSRNLSIILLDLTMPLVSGLDMLKKVRAVNDDIIVMIMTGKSSHEGAVKCADLHVQAYILKPFSLSELKRRMTKLIHTMDLEHLRLLWGEDFKFRMTNLGPLSRKALAFIHQNYAVAFNREELSRYINMNADYLGRLFNKECGIPLSMYINGYKIFKSCEYLANHTAMRIQDVSRSVGFSDVNNFCRLFKKHTGKTPTSFRKSLPHS